MVPFLVLSVSPNVTKLQNVCMCKAGGIVMSDFR